jgi:hypothetical protein
MTKPSNQCLRNALLTASVIIGVLATGLFLNSGAAQRRAESGRTGATPADRPAGRTDAGDLVPGRPNGGYGFGGGSLRGLPIGVANVPQQGSQNQPAAR